MRKGGVSELAFHPEIGVYESAGRTGHHIGSNQEFYVDRASVAFSRPGCLAIGGWRKVFGDKYPPRLTCLDHLQQVMAEKMLTLTFVVSHPDFFPDGPLRPILQSSFALLLMYYLDTEKDLGLNSDL